jgi:hypothetical protein
VGHLFCQDPDDEFPQAADDEAAATCLASIKAERSKDTKAIPSPCMLSSELFAVIVTIYAL